MTRRLIVSLAALAALICAVASPAGAAECANEAIRVEQHATNLPECRAWEMVSSSNKQGGEVFFTQNMGGFGLNAVTAPSTNGERFVYGSFRAWGEDPNGAADSYIATRTANGWQSEAASPPPTEAHPSLFTAHAGIEDITGNFERAVSVFDIGLNPEDQDNGAPFAGADLYVREPNGEWVWASRGNENIAKTTPTGEAEAPVYAGRSADASHVLFETTQKLVPADDAQEYGKALYDRVEGRTELVNVTSGGNLLSTCGAVIGGLAETFDAVSENGSHVYFTAPDPSQSGMAPSCEVPGQVYLRDGTETIDISASQRSSADPAGTQPASFEGASANGERAFFTSGQALTNEAEPVAGASEPFLYEYDVSTKQLHLLTPNLSGGGSPNVKRVVAVSNDGAEVYFVAEPNVAGKLKPLLEMYANGHVTEIAEMWSGFFDYSSAGEAERQVRLSADGLHLVFADNDHLTGFNSSYFREIYMYDATSQELKCLSCNSEERLPLGSAALSEDSGGLSALKYPLSMNVTANGSKVFFQTVDKLVPADDNGVSDVYEWSEGGVHLLSSGHGEAPAYLVGGADEGRDVFFTTTDSLAPQDTDNGDNDVYDARIGGGFAAGASAPSCVSGCQEAVGPPPPVVAPASASIGQDGNVHPAPKSKKGGSRPHAGKRKARGRRRHEAGARRHRSGKRRTKKRKRTSGHARKSRASRATGHRDAPSNGR